MFLIMSFDAVECSLSLPIYIGHENVDWISVAQERV
jgi:hypothetical protein